LTTSSKSSSAISHRRFARFLLGASATFARLGDQISLLAVSDGAMIGLKEPEQA
jgi:hypothetical protein